MDIKVKVLEVKIVTVKLTKAIVRQLDVTHEQKNGDEIVGRIASSVLPDASIYSDALLIARGDTLVILPNASTFVRGSCEYPKLVII